MRDLKKIDVGVLNITTHPHSPEKYLQLFQDVLDTKRVSVYRGSDHLTFGAFNGIGAAKKIDGIWGVFYIFVNIDTTGPVLNITNGEPIVSKEGEVTFPAPAHLKPNLKCVDFVFFPKGHRLFFSTKTTPLGTEQPRQISARILAGALYRLFNHPDLFEKYGEVNVYTENKSEIVADILKIPSLTKLSIAITLPNDDDVSQQMARLTKKYQLEKIKNVQHNLTGYKEVGLAPDKETQAMMQLASSNGSVTAIGWSGEERVEISTTDHPEILKGIYSPAAESKLQALARIAKNALENFTGKK
jgi:hypothetical protein